MLTESGSVSQDVDDYLDEVDDIRKTVEEHLSKWNTFQTTLQYFKVVKIIDNLRYYQLFIPHLYKSINF